MDIAYSVALLTRGTGAYVYDYQAGAGFDRGDLCAVSFRGSLEIGVVLGPAQCEAATGKLLPLCPAAVDGDATWGQRLCDLAELCAATPREVTGYLLFAPPAQGLKIQLGLAAPEELPVKLRGGIADLCGALTPAKRKRLMKLTDWGALAAQVTAGAVKLTVRLAGLPGVTRPHGKLRKHYVADRATLNLLGLRDKTPPELPGNYLAGLMEDLDFGLESTKPPAEPVSPGEPPAHSKLAWQDLDWPAGWALIQRWPAIGDIKVRRSQATWEKLRGSGGLVAELSGDIAAGRNTLVIAPQAWMLDRIWPSLSPWAARVHRFRSDAGPTGAASVLRMLDTPGQVICGTAGAWKLAAHAHFDRVLLLDPTHPGFEAEGDPWLDPRAALFTALAGQTACLDIIELGLSLWDGAIQLRQAALMAPREPDDTPAARGGHVDIDPLPLHLRQPGRRRLVYFNRLGQGRGLRCAECGTSAVCPNCSSRWLYYSGGRGAYACPDCKWESRDLRCRNCGTATLAAELAGLEALTRREGDALVYGTRTSRPAHPETSSVMGTAQLLEPLAEFWPQEIVYVHAETRPDLVDDWPRAVDMVSRLCALYANPQLQYAYIVNARLREKLGPAVTTGQIATAFTQEFTLRQLAGLPPFGRVLRLRWRGPDARSVGTAARAVMAALRKDAADITLNLGQPHRRRDGFHLAGYAVNPGLGHDELQRLRFKHKQVSMSIKVVWGPWA